MQTPVESVRLVDADVHPVMTAEERDARLPHRLRDHLARYGRRSATASEAYPRAANAGFRLDAKPEAAELPVGSDPGLARSQLLDEYGFDYAILNPSMLLACHEPRELASALAQVTNDWLREVWLDADERFLGAIVVPVEHPDAAVLEIQRCAGDARLVQVLIPAGTEENLGSAKYEPVFAAAAEAGLPVAVHFGGFDAHAGAGWPSYYLEEHVAYAVRIQSQVLSLLCSGVLERLPSLRFVLTEFGFAWFPAFRAAADNAWRLFRDDLGGSEQRPSEVLHERFWLTTQPIDEPPDAGLLPVVIEQGDLADRLLFSTDYPHWDFDSPKQALPRSLSQRLKDKIFAGNACELHGLPHPSRVREHVCS
jgi:uncharacterized protein